MNGQWVDWDVRDQIIEFVRYWSVRTSIPVKTLIAWIGIRVARYYDWVERFGRPNRHNGKVPCRHWVTPEERAAILEFHALHRDVGYRRLTYMMIDRDVAAVSPATVYRILSSAGRLEPWSKGNSRRGRGFQQPLKPHQHWHVDISYLNILGTFYYLCSVLDGYSRYVVHWEIRESMKTTDVQTIVLRATENMGMTPVRLISDNGPQFIAREFKTFVRMMGTRHVRTAPYYPQSNGKIERYQKSIKSEGLRKTVLLSLEDARDCVARFVVHYNEERLHSALGYIAPKDMLEGRASAIQAARDEKLTKARLARRRQAPPASISQHIRMPSEAPLLDEAQAEKKNGTDLAIPSSPHFSSQRSLTEQVPRYNQHPPTGPPLPLHQSTPVGPEHSPRGGPCSVKDARSTEFN